MAKRRVLPKDFHARMSSVPLAELVAVYDDHLLTAYLPGDKSRRSPLTWGSAPEGLIRWLIAEGLDVNGPDADGLSPLFRQAEASRAYGASRVRLLIELGADVHRHEPSSLGDGFTALHIAAFRGGAAAVEVLLAAGADADARDSAGETALERTMRASSLRSLPTLAGVVVPLVRAGAAITDAMREQAATLGREIAALRTTSSTTKNVENSARHASDFAPLAEVFGLVAEPPRGHDPTAEIFIPRASAGAQHRVLWEALVPAAGPAATAQGEAIRISGRVAHEVLEMGGVNWDDDFRAMLAHLPVLLGGGTPLDDTALAHARRHAERLRNGRDTPQARRQVAELRDLAVAWVANNRQPIPRGEVPYAR